MYLKGTVDGPKRIHGLPGDHIVNVQASAVCGGPLCDHLAACDRSYCD